MIADDRRTSSSPKDQIPEGALSEEVPSDCEDDYEETNEGDEVSSSDINFAKIKGEFRNIFTDRDLGEMSSTAAQNLALGAFPSGFDVSSDLQLFWQFAFGEEYVVKVNSPYDDYLNGSQCIPVSKTRMVQQFWNESAFDMLDESYTDTYSLLCTIHDPFYAC